MCGRYVIISTPQAIKALFGYGELPNFPARYNVAPTQPVPIVRLVAVATMEAIASHRRAFRAEQGPLIRRQDARATPKVSLRPPSRARVKACFQSRAWTRSVTTAEMSSPERSIALIAYQVSNISRP